MNPIDEIVGKNLRDIRIKRGMSQEDIGTAVGLSFQQIQKYERGTNRISASRLVEFANTLEVELEQLFTGVQGEIKKAETRTLADVRREQKVTEEYNHLPEDVQVAVANLVKAIFINLGQNFKDGAR